MSLNLQVYLTSIQIGSGDEATFVHGEPMLRMLEMLQREEVVPEFVGLFDDVLCFDHGAFLVKVHDHRFGHSAFQKNGAHQESYAIRIQPSALSLWCDMITLASMSSNGSKEPSEKAVLELESRILLATSEPLLLDPSPAVCRQQNVIYYNRNKMNFRRARKRHMGIWRADHEDSNVSVEGRQLMLLMDERQRRSFQPSFDRLDFIQAWRKRRALEDSTPSVFAAEGNRKQVSEDRTIVRTIRFQRERKMAVPKNSNLNNDREPTKKFIIYTLLNIFLVVSTQEYEAELRWGTKEDTSIDGATLRFHLGPKIIAGTYITSFTKQYSIDNDRTFDNGPSLPQVHLAVEQQQQPLQSLLLTSLAQQTQPTKPVLEIVLPTPTHPNIQVPSTQPPPPIKLKLSSPSKSLSPNSKVRNSQAGKIPVNASPRQQIHVLPSTLVQRQSSQPPQVQHQQRQQQQQSFRPQQHDVFQLALPGSLANATSPAMSQMTSRNSATPTAATPPLGHMNTHTQHPTSNNIQPTVSPQVASRLLSNNMAAATPHTNLTQQTSTNNNNNQLSANLIQNRQNHTSTNAATAAALQAQQNQVAMNQLLPQIDLHKLTPAQQQAVLTRRALQLNALQNTLHGNMVNRMQGAMNAQNTNNAAGFNLTRPVNNLQFGPGATMGGMNLGVNIGMNNNTNGSMMGMQNQLQYGLTHGQGNVQFQGGMATAAAAGNGGNMHLGQLNMHLSLANMNLQQVYAAAAAAAANGGRPSLASLTPSQIAHLQILAASQGAGSGRPPGLMNLVGAMGMNPGGMLAQYNQDSNNVMGANRGGVGRGNVNGPGTNLSTGVNRPL